MDKRVFIYLIFTCFSYVINQKLNTAKTVKEKDEIIEHLVSAPKYKTSTRTKRKLTKEIKDKVDLKLEENRFKRNNGMRKQQLKGIDIYELL